MRRPARPRTEALERNDEATDPLSAFAGLLDRHKREVRRVDELVERAPMQSVERETGAGRYLLARDERRVRSALGNGLNDPTRRALRGFGVDAGNDPREFVAADSSHAVTGAGAARQDVRDFFE